MVSPDGAGNVEGAAPSITALPAIAAAISQHGTILLDSGIRHGADIARALALCADAVLPGRAGVFLSLLHISPSRPTFGLCLWCVSIIYTRHSMSSSRCR